MNKKHTSIKTFILLLVAIVVVSCGQKKKSPAILFVTPDKMEVYLNEFKSYFKIVNDASDAGKWLELQRYTIAINSEITEPIEGCFLINVTDKGDRNVRVVVTYTVGSQSSNATIVNPNFIGGLGTINSSFNLALDESDEKSRAKTIATAIYNRLVEIEGE